MENGQKREQANITETGEKRIPTTTENITPLTLNLKTE